MWKRVTVRHGAQFVKHVVPAVVKPARVLWNEVIGFLFLCLAVMFGSKTVQLFMDFSGASAAERGMAGARLGLAGFSTALMLWFGVSSFLRARRISRS